MIIIKKIPNYLKDQSGATAVEFALVAILFLTFVFGIIEAGRMFWTWNTLQYSVEQAARYALVNPDALSTEIEQVIISNMQGIQVNPNNMTATITTTTLSNINFIEINAEYSFTALTTILPDAFNTVVLTADTRLPISSN